MTNSSALLKKYATPPQKLFIYLVLATYLAYLLLYSLDVSEPNRFNSWEVGDWLINYAGGFIRRGLGGYLIIGVSSFLKIRPELIVFFIKAIFYSIIYFGLMYLISKKKLSVLDFLILLSPLAFSFPILDLNGSGRKEIILLSGMMILAIRSTLGFKIPRPSTLSFLLFFLTLLHEGLIFFYPLFLLLLPIIFGSKKYNLKEIASILLPSIMLVFFFSFIAVGVSQEKLLAILKEIDSINFDAWNNGALKALTWTSSYSVGQVIRYLTTSSIISSGLALLLFWFMFYSVGVWKALNRELSIHPNELFIVFLFQLPLFIVTLDWGRWLYIDASLLAIYYLTKRVDQREANLKSSASTNLVDAETMNLKNYVSFIFLLAISVTLWKTNHCCTEGASWGVLTRPIFKLLGS